jgi:hypothetical protein
MAPAFTITDQHETETISPTVKVVPVLEWTPRHEDVCIDLRILNLHPWRSWVVSFKPRPL